MYFFNFFQFLLIVFYLAHDLDCLKDVDDIIDPAPFGVEVLGGVVHIYLERLECLGGEHPQHLLGQQAEGLLVVGGSLYGSGEEIRLQQERWQLGRHAAALLQVGGEGFFVVFRGFCVVLGLPPPI